MDRIPKERYFDADFYALEGERLWSRVWQMACRLEEIPDPRDFVPALAGCLLAGVVAVPVPGVATRRAAGRRGWLGAVESGR